MKIKNGSCWHLLMIGAIIMSVLASCSGGKEEGLSGEDKEWKGERSDYGEKIETLKSRLFDDPDNLQLLSSLGDAYFESQRYDEAIKIYDKALKVSPDDPDSLNDKGLSYFYNGDSDKALESINKATEVAPDYVHSWLSKGFILMSIGKYDEAVPSLDRVKELDLGGTLAEEADNFLAQIKAIQG